MGPDFPSTCSREAHVGRHDRVHPCKASVQDPVTQAPLPCFLLCTGGATFPCNPPIAVCCSCPRHGRERFDVGCGTCSRHGKGVLPDQ